MRRAVAFVVLSFLILTSQENGLMTRQVTPEEKKVLETMASDGGTDLNTQKRALAVLAYLESSDIAKAVAASGLSRATVRKVLAGFESNGWQGLLSVSAPRGGDFLARYDQGFWAERLVRGFLDGSTIHRPIPYGTSRSEPFTDMQTFKKYAVSEALLQTWSAGQRWKRPDLLCVPRQFLREKEGTDTWTPDLLHLDNDRCSEFVAAASAAIEVETSLWQVKKCVLQLSFTVKEEDLPPLRNWVKTNRVPLYIVQVFYDQAYALPFTTFEYLISPAAPSDERVVAIEDRFTKKPTYSVPLTYGKWLGDIPEADVEGRIFKADNGRVTVYGRLTGSQIEPADPDVLELLAGGKLK
jgi:hypothetical protein